MYYGTILIQTITYRTDSINYIKLPDLNLRNTPKSIQLLYNKKKFNGDELKYVWTNNIAWQNACHLTGHVTEIFKKIPGIKITGGNNNIQLVNVLRFQ